LEPSSKAKSKDKDTPKQQIIGILLEVKETAEVKLLFSYLVHDASWTPKYDLRVSSVDKKMEVSYFGLIQQNTGEDWYVCTINGESFAGLNFRSFDPMKYFAEILSRFIGQECSQL